MKQIWSHPVSQLVVDLDIRLNFALEYKIGLLFPSPLVKKNYDQSQIAIKSINFPGEGVQVAFDCLLMSFFFFL